MKAKGVDFNMLTGTNSSTLLSEDNYLPLSQHFGKARFPATLITLLVLTSAYLIYLERSDLYLPNLPWVGRTDEWFSKVRASFRQYRSGWATLKEGQEKYGKNGIPYILPQSTFQSIVIVPQSYLKWMMKQPETVLSAIAVQRELVGFQHVIPWAVSDTCLHLSNAIINAMRTSLKSSETLLQRRMIDQVKQCVDGRLGLDEFQWKEVDLFDFMSKVTYRVSLQVWVDETLYDNEAFLDAFESFSFWLNSSNVLLSCWTPPVFTTIFGSLLRIPLSISKRRCMNHILPVIKERWEQVTNMKESLSAAIDNKIPNDFFLSTVKMGMGQKYSKSSCPEYISSILLFTGASAMPTSGVTGTNVLLDLLSSNPEYIKQIRKEVEEAFIEATDLTDPSLLAKLSHLDSAVRESLRLNPIIAIEPRRKIMDPNGLTLPNGQHLPQDTWLGISFLDLHLNEESYPNSQEYLPFRFVKAQEKGFLEKGDKNQPIGGSDPLLVATGSSFVGFGAGRHTCPGRWLAATQIKLILAYVVLHYDLKPLCHRPGNQKIGAFNVPNMQQKFWVRRRTAKAGSDLEKAQDRFQNWMLSKDDV